MQLYVQKSTSTTFPFKDASVSGALLGELIYPAIWANSGAF